MPERIMKTAPHGLLRIGFGGTPLASTTAIGGKNIDYSPYAAFGGGASQRFWLSRQSMTQWLQYSFHTPVTEGISRDCCRLRR